MGQRKHSPNHNAVPRSGAHQGFSHPFYFSKGCNSFFRRHQSLPVPAPEGTPAQRRAGKTKSACFGGGTQHCYLTFIPPTTRSPPQSRTPKLTSLSLRVKPSPLAAPAWSCCCSPASGPSAQQLLLCSQLSLGSARMSRSQKNKAGA